LSTGHAVTLRVHAANNHPALSTPTRRTVHFTSTDPTATLPADYTFTTADNGQHTFTDAVTYNTAGDRSVEASGAATPAVRGDSGPSQVSAAAATYLDVQVFDGSVPAGHQVGMRVRAFDVNADVDTGYRGTVHFTSTDPAAALPGDYTFTAGDAGDRTFATGVVYVTPGNR